MKQDQKRGMGNSPELDFDNHYYFVSPEKKRLSSVLDY